MTEGTVHTPRDLPDASRRTLLMMPWSREHSHSRIWACVNARMQITGCRVQSAFWITISAYDGPYVLRS